MPKQSRILLENISTESINSTYTYGQKYKGAGYHRRNNTLTTVIYDVDNFIGSIKIQATLELEPAESDWVDIVATELGNSSDSTIWTTSQSLNFIGNWIWIRAAYNVQNGSIQQIRYNY